MEPTSKSNYQWSFVIFRYIDLLLFDKWINIISYLSNNVLNLSNNKRYESERYRIGIQRPTSDKNINSVDF